MVYVKVTFKVAIRTSQTVVVVLMTILFYRVTCMRLSILHVNCVLLNVLNRITCLSYICKRECSLCNAKACDQEQIIETFASNSDSAQVFNDLTCTDETPAMLDHAISLIGVDIDEALRVFNNCIRQNAEYMKNTDKDK